MSREPLTDKEINELLAEFPFQEAENKKSGPKYAFEDIVNPYKYIELDSNALAFDRVNRVLNRNLKMTLIYGAPGTGKSMFLNKLHNNLLIQSKYSILVSSPILEDSQLFRTISFEIFKELSSINYIPQDFNSLIETINLEVEYISRIRPILLLDEAQLYSNATLEKIRVLADTQKIRVIFAVHQLKEANIFAQEHFKSRIWEKIELKNASLNELKIYIQKKLMGVSALQLAKQFTKRVVRNIYKITKGNYRVTNNLLYSYFNNYPQLYKQQFQNQWLKVRVKEIEITAIQIDFIHLNISSDIDLQHLPTAELEWKNWKKREYIKYILVFLIPTLIYMIINIFFYEDTSVTSHKNLGIREFPKEVFENNSSITFDTPQYQEIIENEISDKLSLIKDKKLEPQNLENNSSKTSKESEENIEIKSKIKKDNLEVKKVQPIKKVQNIPISDLNISPIYFQQIIKIYPDLSFLDNFHEYIDKKSVEEKYIISLKLEFKKNKTVETGIKILDYYQKNENIPEIYRFSLELNNLDLSLKKPYINLEKILKAENILDEIQKIKAGCKNCEF